MKIKAEIIKLPFHLKQFLEAGEGESLDYKQEVTSENKIAKTMVSFANHKGGTLLVGVKDDRTISGIAPEEEKFMLEKAAGFFCKPELEIEIKEWRIGKKTVLEVIIPQGNQKPYYALGDDGKWWAYIRVKDQSLLASKVVIDVLKKQTNNEDTAIPFTDKEKSLLNYLAAHPKITLKQFCQLVNISRRRATGILVNLISLGVIRVHQTEKPEYYTLS